MSLETIESLNFVQFAIWRQKYIVTFVQKKQGPLTDMEVVDVGKKSLEDTLEEHEFFETNDQTAEADTNGELTQEDVDKFQQNHWQFSDEGRREEFGK